MIIHLDLDSFFVSAERIMNYNLIGVPVIVGGRGDPFIFSNTPTKNKRLIQLNQGAFVPSLFAHNSSSGSYFREGEKLRGIVTTASYEARKRGVKTAMTIYEALKHCPEAILVPPNHLLYHTLSHEMVKLLEREVPLVEQYSIDEVFMDVKGWIADEDIEAFMKELQDKITKELFLPVSVGASSSKWIAKLATSRVKPYGTKLVKKEEIRSFVEDIDINDFPGVGRAYSKKMHKYKIKTIGDALRAKELLYSWGRGGRDLYAKMSGTDKEQVNSKHTRKGVGMSRSMDYPIKERSEFYRRVRVMVRHWSHTIMKLGVNPTTFYFSIGYEHHLRSKKQYTLYRIFNEKFIQEFALEKFEELDIYTHLKIKYIAMSGTKFLHHDRKSLDMFNLYADKESRVLYESITKMRDKYGMDIIRSGRELLG